MEVEENTGGNGVDGTPNNDMTDEGMTFEKTHKDSSFLEPHVKACACVRLVKYCLYTIRCVHGSCHCLDAKLPEKISRLQMEVQSIMMTMTKILLLTSSAQVSLCK